ncbi:TBC1 domain family member 5 [Entamoeba marina]
MDCAKVKQILNSFFLDNNSSSKLKDVAYKEGLTSSMRTLSWHIFLNNLHLPVAEQWVEIISKQRKRYEQLRVQHWDNKNKLEPKQTFVDPLAPPTVDPEIIKNKDILRRVETDVQRLYSDNPYFTSDSFRSMITRMCYIFAKDNENLEIEEPFKSVLTTLYDNVYLEHDSYALFECLMKDLGYLFEFKDAARTAQDLMSSHIQTKCEQIFERLSKFDGQYHVLLTKHNVQSMIGIKWLKMLFAREFHLEDSIIIWDSLFAFGNSLQLCDNFFLAMLYYIRNDIMDHDDELYTMKRITKFPPVENVHNLVQVALNFSNNKPPTIPKKEETKNATITGKLSGFLQKKNFVAHPKPKQVQQQHPKILEVKTPSTLYADSTNETPDWIVESPWGDGLPLHISGAPPIQTASAPIVQSTHHETIKTIIDVLNKENQKEVVDAKTIKEIIQKLNEMIEK